MLPQYRIWEEVYIVGGADISHPSGCSIYLTGGEEPVVIDSGAGAKYYGMAYHTCKVDIKLSKEEEVLYYGDYERKVHITGHMPGGIAIYADMGKRVLFGQDVHGPYFLRGSDITQARLSLQKLIDLEADILCEGHFGTYQPGGKVKHYIDGYLDSL